MNSAEPMDIEAIKIFVKDSIRELRELHDKATPEPWTAKGASVKKRNGFMMHQPLPPNVAPESCESIVNEWKANAQLTAKMRNMLPDLLDIFEDIMDFQERMESLQQEDGGSQ